jgi:nitrate/nitrite-specific signal transduction histidine kinase
MRERAQSMGSQLKIESAPERGTCISVEVPVHSSHAINEELKTNTYSGGG